LSRIARHRARAHSAKLPKRRIKDAEAIQQALEIGGIEFIDSVGVRLLPR
jgi:hypothetical protein